MIQGETVTVLTTANTKPDPFNNLVTTEETAQEVKNVLVCPTTDADKPQETRPDKTLISLTVHMPKTFTGSLEGAHMIVRGRRYKVIGDPQAYTAANCPTLWHMPVELGAADG